MKQLFMGMLVSLIIVSNVYAEKIITVTISDEQYSAMTILAQTPEEWSQHAVESKANKMINRLCNDYSDMNVDKLTNAEKKAIIDGIDLETEKAKRHPVR